MTTLYPASRTALLRRNFATPWAFMGGHLWGDGTFVVIDVLKREGEGANWFGMMACGESEDGAGIEAAAEVNANGNIGAETNADGFFEDVAKLGSVVGVGSFGRGVASGGIVEVPIASDLQMLLGGD